MILGHDKGAIGKNPICHALSHSYTSSFHVLVEDIRILFFYQVNQFIRVLSVSHHATKEAVGAVQCVYPANSVRVIQWE